MGSLCLLLGSGLSGLGGAIVEWILQRKRRDSAWDARGEEEWAPRLSSHRGDGHPAGPGHHGEPRHQLRGPVSDVDAAYAAGFRWVFHSALRFIPVVSQGWGGIVVGLIAKTSGSVRKGFAVPGRPLDQLWNPFKSNFRHFKTHFVEVMVGLIFSCILKALVEGERLSWSTLMAVPLVAISIYLHAKYPPKAAKQS